VRCTKRAPGRDGRRGAIGAARSFAERLLGKERTMKRLLCGLTAATLLSAGPAAALSISGLTTSNLTGGVWGDGIAPEPDCPSVVPFCPGQSFDDDSAGIAPNGWNEWQSGITSTAGATTFSTRFANSLASQSQTVINTALHYDADHSITFTVNHTGSWSIQLDLSRVAQIVVQDGSGIGTGAGSIAVSSLITAVSGASLFSGSLSLPSASQGSDGSQNLNQTTSAVLSGSGNSVVTLTLSFDIDTYTAGQVFGSGDAVCYRGGAGWFGNTDCSSGGGPSQGVFVSGTLVPEPGTLALLGAGVAGVGAFGRRGRAR